MLVNNFSPMPVMLIASSAFLKGRPFIKCLAFTLPIPSTLRKSSALPLLSNVSIFERSAGFIRLTCAAAFFCSAGVASLNQGLVFDGPFLPAGRVLFFDFEESLLVDDFVPDDLLLALLDDLLLLALLEELFLEVVFELEGFFLVLDFFELVAFGVEDLLDDFLEDFCLVLDFDLGFDCATAGDARQIASRMARRVLITKLHFGREG